MDKKMTFIPGLGSGSGSSLPLPVLVLAGTSTAIAVAVSATSIVLHLRNYRKPILQRMVVRIMLMVPLYAVSSFISLFSLQAAFFIDAVRDIYEAFVIYCFFELLVAYLGGERSLLILLHGRPPKYPVFPGNLFWREVDVSDPHTFLLLKRGVLQYVQVKPVLALATIVLKATGKYNEGDLRANSGYLYVSFVYNASICISLYCLAIFWMCVNDDLKPFRPMPKFLCVKGILFFSFWQSIFISLLVAARAITHLGPYTDTEHISLGLTDSLITLEMPLFALAHQYAFSTRDFTAPLLDPRHPRLSARAVARMRMWYAFRDAFGVKDVLEDSKATLRGEGMDYREFEPSEGGMHQGAGRERRIRAGLRYAQGGKRKYWLPQVVQGDAGAGAADADGGGGEDAEVYAPLLAAQAEDVVHLAPDMQDGGGAYDAGEEYDLSFGDDLDGRDEELYAQSRRLVFGDYNYPVVDVSCEAARRRVWDEEERILRDERGLLGGGGGGGGGGVGVAVKRVLGGDGAGYGAVDRFRRGAVGTSRDEAVIDKEHDRWDGGADGHLSPNARERERGDGDVKLGWMKFRAAGSPRVKASSSQSASLSPSASSPASFSRTSSSGGSRTARPSQGPAASEPERVERVVRPDAVDLVVEDERAGEEGMAWARRKGEPHVRGAGVGNGNGVGGGGGGRVLRGFWGVDEDEGREGEVDGDEEVDTREGGEGGGGVVDEEVVVTRAGTPPRHVRMMVDEYRIPSEDNPWA